MHDAGGGRFTNYQECSFRSEGIGTFKGMDGAKPFIGTKGILERTPEVKLEMPVETWNLGATIAAMLREHPYEEVAYDVSPLHNENKEYGLGTIGEFSDTDFSGKIIVSRQKSIRHSIPSVHRANRTAKVNRIAVCGGAGSELVPEAIRQHADAYITADIKYHGFQDAERDILLIDAGHFETEYPILPVLAQRVKEIMKKRKSAIKSFHHKEKYKPSIILLA